MSWQELPEAYSINLLVPTLDGSYDIETLDIKKRLTNVYSITSLGYHLPGDIDTDQMLTIIYYYLVKEGHQEDSQICWILYDRAGNEPYNTINNHVLFREYSWPGVIQVMTNLGIISGPNTKRASS